MLTDEHEIRFLPDGRVINEQGTETDRWKVDRESGTIQLWQSGEKAARKQRRTLWFNADFTGFSYYESLWQNSGYGVRKEALAPVKTAPQETTSLQVLTHEAPNAIEWALAPLDRSIPTDIRKNIVLLREALQDDSTKAARTSESQYRSAAKLCNGLLAVIEERRLTQVRADFATAEAETRYPVNSQALQSNRNYKMSWPQYQREEAERAELKKGSESKTAVAKMRSKVQWSERTTLLRRDLEALYSQFREDARRAS